MKTEKTIEYWVEELNEDGDIVDHLYQGNNKQEALEIARTAIGFKIEVERVTRYGNEASGIQRQVYQSVDIDTGKLGEMRDA